MSLTVSWERSISYRNQSIGLQSKSMVWFLNDRNFRHERVKLRSLLLAILKAYGFSNQILRLLQGYLCNRFQRSITNGSFSSWNEVITGVPQGSILGPLLFKIFLSDIFLFILKCQLSNYADDNTLYKSGKNMQKIKTIWKWISWFYTNGFMKITWC